MLNLVYAYLMPLSRQKESQQIADANAVDLDPGGTLAPMGLAYVTRTVTAVPGGIQMVIVLQTTPMPPGELTFEDTYTTPAEREIGATSLFTDRLNQALRTLATLTSLTIF